MKRIMCFGDSNTWGAIPNQPERYDESIRWTRLLARMLGDEYEIIEEAQNGRTTVFTDVIEERMAGIEYFVPCLDSQSPLDLIILMLGTNDLKTRFDVNAWSIADGLRRYDNALKTTRNAGKFPKMLLMAPIRIHPGYKNDPLFHDLWGEDGVERSKGFADAYREAAALYGWDFLNAADYAEASEKDGIHMEPEGHAALAKAVAEKVKEIL